MMNLKRAIGLAITFVILVVFYYLIEKPPGSRDKEQPAQLIAGFESDKAAVILLKSPEKDDFRLTHADNSWQVMSNDKTYAADAAPILKALETVSTIKAETIASKNPKNFEAFEVTQAKGVEVKIKDAAGNNLAHFFVGKSGPDIFSTYVRNANSNRVILTSGILKTVFEKELKEWRDKTIFRLNKDDIIEYRIEGDMTLHLKKDDKNTWQVVAPEAFPAKKQAAEDVVNKFASLAAVDFPEGDLSEFQLDKPLRRVTAFFKNNKTETLLVGKQKNAFQQFVKVKDRATVFVVENYMLEAPSAGLDKFREEQEKEAAASDNATN